MSCTAVVITSVWKLGIAMMRSREDEVQFLPGLCSRRKLKEWDTKDMLEKSGEGRSRGVECLEDIDFGKPGVYEKGSL